MGTWGTGVLDDDFARDVYDRYEDEAAEGHSAEAIVRTLAREFASSVDHPDEGPVFWLAVAHAQWDGGNLAPDVRAKVEAIVSQGLGLARWEEAGPTELKRRKAALAKFAAKIATPRRTKRKVSKPVPVPLAVGDCLAIDLGDGRFGAAVVTRFEPGRSSSHILSIVDYHDTKPPAPAVFAPPKWLQTPGDPTTIIKYCAYADGFRRHGAKYTVIDRITVDMVPPPLTLAIANWSSVWKHLGERFTRSP